MKRKIARAAVWAAQSGREFSNALQPAFQIWQSNQCFARHYIIERFGPVSGGEVGARHAGTKHERRNIFKKVNMAAQAQVTHVAIRGMARQRRAPVARSAPLRPYVRTSYIYVSACKLCAQCIAGAGMAHYMVYPNQVSTTSCVKP